MKGKPTPLSKLKPGTLCHFVEPMSGDEVRTYFWRVEKRRKPKILNDGKKTIVPLMFHGLIQGVPGQKPRVNTFHMDKPAHYYVDSRYCVIVKKDKKTWKP